MKTFTSTKEFKNIFDEMLYDFQKKDLFAIMDREDDEEFNEDDERLADQEHRWEADNDR